jgi:FG-GAP repeat
VGAVAGFGSVAVAVATPAIAVPGPEGASGAKAHQLQFVHKLRSPHAPPQDHFGEAVAAYGRTLVVGAPYRRVRKHVHGLVYVYRRPRAGWEHVGKRLSTLTAGPAVTELGNAVGISGRLIVASGTVSNEGAVLSVYVRPPHGWSKVNRPTTVLHDGRPSQGLNGGFDVSGTTIVAGAGPTASKTGTVQDPGAAYLFVRPRSGWRGVHEPTARLTGPHPMTFDNFGSDVALDGSVLVVGASSQTVQGRDSQGVAYMFVRPQRGWAFANRPRATLLPSNGSAYDGFGDSVAIHGNTVIVGAPHHRRTTYNGGAYVYVRPRDGWAGALTQSAFVRMAHCRCTGLFGWSVAVSSWGIAVGDINGKAYNKGALFALRTPQGGWAGPVRPDRYVDPHGNALDSLGRSIAMSGRMIFGGEPHDPEHILETTPEDRGATIILRG